MLQFRCVTVYFHRGHVHRCVCLESILPDAPEKSGFGHDIFHFDLLTLVTEAENEPLLFSIVECTTSVCRLQMTLKRVSVSLQG